MISELLFKRTGKQVRERYLQILNPNIIKAKFTPEEDEFLIKLIEMHGTK